MTNHQIPTPNYKLPMMIRAVIFDIGGVLIRTNDRTSRQKWEWQLGLTEGKLSQLAFGTEVARRAMVGQATEVDVWQEVARTLKLDDERMRELISDFWSCEGLDAELVQFAQTLRPRYKTAILSNAFSSARDAVSKNFKLDQAVDQMIISAEVGLAKPDARIFHLACERIGIAPPEAVFIDDVLENIESARSIGMHGVQFKDTAQAIDEVKQYLAK